MSIHHSCAMIDWPNITIFTVLRFSAVLSASFRMVRGIIAPKGTGCLGVRIDEINSWSSVPTSLVVHHDREELVVGPLQVEYFDPT